MTSKEKIIDIKYLIMEHYSDKQPLEDYQKASRNCFFKYCDDIKQDLERSETLEEENKELKEKLNKGLIIFEQNKKLFSDIKKLKQAIDILKDKFNLKVQALHLLNSEIQYELQLREHCTTYCFSIPKDIYELLKEVLGK